MRLPSTMKIAFSMAVAAAFGVAGVAEAQYVPYGGYGQGGWGGWSRPSASYIPRDAMAAQKGADRRQALALNAAQQKSRNDLLLGQAQRSSATINQSQQASRDAWRDVAMRQDEARAARQRSLAAARVPTVRLPGLTEPETPKPPAATTEPGTRWPTLLNDSRFAVPRAKLQELLSDAAASTDGLTTAEYEEIVKQAEEMKDVLRRMASELNAAEYLAVERFLNDLTAKAKAAVKPTP